MRLDNDLRLLELQTYRCNRTVNW